VRISTGLRPRAVLQILPERDSPQRIYRDTFNVTIPVPNLKTREVWILTFQFVSYFDDGEMYEGDVMETMLSITEPHIEKKSFKYGIANEFPHRAEAEEHYRRQYNPPDDALRSVKSFFHTEHTEVTFNWWEVTI
jgi:hypothetical protein